MCMDFSVAIERYEKFYSGIVSEREAAYMLHLATSFPRLTSHAIFSRKLYNSSLQDEGCPSRQSALEHMVLNHHDI